MGLFDFFKKKDKGIDKDEFYSEKFQKSIFAVALWKYNESNAQPKEVIEELKKFGLSDSQGQYMVDQVQSMLSKSSVKDEIKSIGENEFAKGKDSYVNQAQKIFFENNHSFEIVSQELFDLGLNLDQVDEIIEALKSKNDSMINDFQQQLDSGSIAEIKIHPNPEHTKENVDKNQVDKYIGFGAYQLDRGDLDNALQLFDKAIELDDQAVLAYANKGKLYAIKNDFVQALFFTNKALEIDPIHEQILDNKVDILFELLSEDKIDEATFISGIQDVLTKNPENPTALVYITQFYLQTQRIQEALQAVKVLFKNYYSDTNTIELMITTMHQLTVEQALSAFDVIEKEVNEEAKYQLRYNKGLYLKGIGKYDEAIYEFNYLNSIQEFSWSFYQMAIIQNIQGKREECFSNLRRTFRLEPQLKEDAKTYPELQNLWNDPEFIELTK